MIQRYHRNGDIAAEARHAGRAADDDMWRSGRAGASQLHQGVEQGGHTLPADVGVVNCEFGQDEFAPNGGDDFVHETTAAPTAFSSFSVGAYEQALGYGGCVVRVALDHAEVGGFVGGENVCEFGGVTAEGDAAVAGGEGVLES